MDSRLHKQTLQNGPWMNPTPEQLRALILDYLCHNCYTRTARAFARDSTVQHLNADGDEVIRPKGEGDSVGITDEDLEQVELRREVQQKLLLGDVDNATSLLNERYPSVLSTSKLPPPGSPRILDPHIKAYSSLINIRSITPSSVDPSILALELRFLAFIETARTEPLPPPALSHLNAPASRPASPNYLRNGRPDIDADERLLQLYESARALYEFVQELGNPEQRADYQEPLERIGSLIAYKIPEKSPVKFYMEQARRDSVADQINSAVLYRMGRPALSYLELYVRYTTVVWKFLNELNVKAPAAANVPQGVKLPPRRRSTVGATSSPSKDLFVDKDNSEIISEFELRDFVSSP